MPSVCLSAWNNSAPNGRIFMKFDIRGFFENLSRNLGFRYNLTVTTGTLHEDLCTLIVISHWIHHSMRNISYWSHRENQNTHFILKVVGKYGRARQTAYENIIRRRKDAIYISDNHDKYRDTHAYWILIAFPRQQRLRERASMLCYTCLVCPVVNRHDVMMYLFSYYCC